MIKRLYFESEVPETLTFCREISSILQLFRLLRNPVVIGSHIDIKNNINETIKKYIPNLIIDSIEFKNNDIEELIVVEVKYTVTEGAFTSSDVVEITF